MNKLSIYNELRAVPAEAKKAIGAGRLKGFTDINPMWRIKKLTETFGMCGFGWRYKIVNQWLEAGANGEVKAFSHIELFVKVDDEWSEAIEGIGGSSFITMESKGAYTSDECFKMAFTDALGIACKALGMAADVYFEKDRTKYDITEEQTKTATNKPKQTEQPPIKETTEQQDLYKIDLIGRIQGCKTIKEVVKLWNENPNYTSLSDVKEAFSKRKLEVQ